MEKQSEKKRAKLKGLKRNLESDDAFKEMERDWESQISTLDELSSPLEEITEYQKRLHKVNLLYSHAENHSRRKRTTAAEDLFHKSKVLA